MMSFITLVCLSKNAPFPPAVFAQVNAGKQKLSLNMKLTSFNEL